MGGKEAQMLYGKVIDLRDGHSRQSHELICEHAKRLRALVVDAAALGDVFQHRKVPDSNPEP
jgi:hypothetical protein